MALEPVGLRAVFETTEFQRGMTIYNNGVMTVNQNSQKTADQSKKNSQQVDQSWSKGFKAVAKNAAMVVAAFYAVNKATQKLQEATQLAARVEMLGVGLETVGKNAGYSKGQIEAFEKAVKDQGITTRAARQSLMRMAQAQIDFTHAADLARVAQDAARIANINSSEAFANMIYGIQSGNVRVLRTMGINVSFQRSYEKLAASMGTTTDALTEQEKSQARVNAVMEAGERIAGTYEASLTTAGGQALSLARQQEESMLILGNVFKDSYGKMIAAQTEAWKGFREWAAKNEEGLDALSKSFATLTEQALEVGKSIFALTETDLTSMLEDLKKVTDAIGQALYYLKQWIAFADAAVQMYREAGRASIENLAKSVMEGGQDVEDVWVDVATRAADKYEETLLKHYPPAVEKAVKESQQVAISAMEEEPPIPEFMVKAAETLTESLDNIAKIQRDHYRRLAQMEADQNRQRARAQERYYRSIEKQEIAGAKRLAQITERYEKRRAKTIADAEKAIARAEREAFEDRSRQIEEFERQERHARERYQLDRLQSERRYQYEWGRALAEGDALALYELQEQHKLEQQEAKENEALRKRQSKENQVAQIQEAGEAARQQIEDLRSQLQEQLAEQDENYHAQIQKQKEANEERLLEMQVNFEEQQALQDENNALARQKQEEAYRRQLEELGWSLRDQKELQELGAEQVAAILQEYYGEGGVADEIMTGYYEREITRAIVTAEALAGIAASAPGMVPPPMDLPTGAGWTGVMPMQHGGILTGPAMAYIEPGMVEAFIPLGRMGGTMNVSGQVGVGWTGGLEGASPAMVNRIAAQVGKRIFNDLTSELKLRRAGQ